MRIHHIALRTPDLERLAGFYVGLLGLSVVQRQADYSVWLSAGTSVLMLERADAEEPAVPEGSREMVAFAIDADGQRALETKLSAVGIGVENRTEHTFYVRDPDGRRVGFSTYAFA